MTSSLIIAETRKFFYRRFEMKESGEETRAMWISGTHIAPHEITDPQWSALTRIRDKWALAEPVQVIPGFGYIMVDVGPMHLGIEPDGHTHS